MSEDNRDLYDQLEDCFDDDMRLIKARKYTQICERFEKRLVTAEAALRWNYDKTMSRLPAPIMSFEYWKNSIIEELTALPEPPK